MTKEEKNNLFSKAFRGCDQSRSELGSCYYFGDGGFKEDKQAASFWLELAAKQHESWACFLLGMQYLFGDHEDGYQPEKAYGLLLAAAEGGNSSAMVELASMDLFGQDVPQNFRRGLKSLEEAAAKGHDQATYRLGLLMKMGVVEEKVLGRAKALMDGALGDLVDPEIETWFEDEVLEWLV